MSRLAEVLSPVGTMSMSWVPFAAGKMKDKNGLADEVVIQRVSLIV